MSWSHWRSTYSVINIWVCVGEERRGEERRGGGERRGAGHQAAVCLDSIHDPSVCHCHSNSQRLQQDGKLHYHIETFSISLLSLSLSLSLSPPHPIPSLFISLSSPLSYFQHPPFFLSNPSETICTLFYLMSLFAGNLPLPLSFSPCTHSSLFASPFLYVSQALLEKCAPAQKITIIVQLSHNAGHRHLH